MTDEERRAEDEAQMLALSKAEDAGQLPAKDRRHEGPPFLEDAGQPLHRDNATTPGNYGATE